MSSGAPSPFDDFKSQDWPSLDVGLSGLRRLLAESFEQDPKRLVAVLCDHQRQHWERGTRIEAESYLKSFPNVAADPECAVDVVYGEFLLREARCENPQPEEYLRRFPQFAVWTQTITGMELDPDGTLHVLDASAWKERRQRLQRLGGTPVLPRSLLAVES
jgi:hypothetical protein